MTMADLHEQMILLQNNGLNPLGLLLMAQQYPKVFGPASLRWRMLIQNISRDLFEETLTVYGIPA
jgi:hypothetical protein